MRGARFFTLVFISAALTACALVAGIDAISIDSEGGNADGAPMNTNDGAADGAFDAAADGGTTCDPAAPFGTPVALTELNSADDDFSASLTPDERVVYFASSRSSTYQLYRAERAAPNGAFGAPVLVTLPSLDGEAYSPSIAPDQLTLIFELSEPSNAKTIRISTRNTAGDSFASQTSIANVNAGLAHNIQPYLTADETSLWFTSDRADSGFAVYESQVASGTFQTPVAATLGSSDEDSWSPVLSGDRLTLYFSSTRGERDGGVLSIYRASRMTPQSIWGAAVVVPNVSAAGSNDYPTWLSPDGCRLYLTSKRSGQNDLYVATRQP